MTQAAEATRGLPVRTGVAAGQAPARERSILGHWNSAVTSYYVLTGATALLVAGLVTRRETTGDRRYDRVLRRMGRFLVAQTEPSVDRRLDPGVGQVQACAVDLGLVRLDGAVELLHLRFLADEVGNLSAEDFIEGDGRFLGEA